MPDGDWPQSRNCVKKHRVYWMIPIPGMRSWPSGVMKSGIELDGRVQSSLSGFWGKMWLLRLVSPDSSRQSEGYCRV